MTIGKDQSDQPFGAPEPTLNLDAGQSPEAGNVAEDPGLLERLGQGVRNMLAQKTVEIDGVTMTATAGKLVAEQGMQFIGSDCIVQVPVQGSPGAERWEALDRSRHNEEQIAGRRRVMWEYLLSPRGDSGRVPGAACAEVHAVRNGVYLGGIGRRLSEDALRRMQAHGTLSPVGEAMIAQATGTAAPFSVLSSSGLLPENTF